MPLVAAAFSLLKPGGAFVAVDHPSRAFLALSVFFRHAGLSENELSPRLRELAFDRQVRSVKRSAAASPATGSAKAHAMEQKTLIDLALSRG